LSCDVLTLAHERLYFQRRCAEEQGARAGVSWTHVRAPLKALIVVAAAVLSLTACGGGPPGLESVPDKSDVLAATLNSNDQGEAALRDKTLGIDLVIQVQDEDTKKPLSGINILVMTSGEDVVFAAIDPEGHYFPAFVTKPRSGLVSPTYDRYVASGPMASPSGTQGTPVVLLMVKTGPIGWQELQIGLTVSDLVQRFGIFQTEYCLTPADLEGTGVFPGKFVLVALPPPGVVEGAPVTSFGVLVDQLAEFLTLTGIPDQPFLARAYRLPKGPLWILEVDGPCTPGGGGPLSPPVSPFASPPGVSPPFVSPPPPSSPPGPQSPPPSSPPAPQSPPPSSPPGPQSPPPSSPPGPQSPPPASPPGPVSPPAPTPISGPVSPPPAPPPGPVSPPPPTPTPACVSPPCLPPLPRPMPGLLP
jgi:hypothetical protein